VQFYERDPVLIEMVCRHFAPGLAAGGTAIFVPQGTTRWM
jgi:hypothetical protein